jgi:hypothetical protein
MFTDLRNNVEHIAAAVRKGDANTEEEVMLGVAVLERLADRGQLLEDPDRDLAERALNAAAFRKAVDAGAATEE